MSVTKTQVVLPELVLNPRWEGRIAEIDGAHLIVLTIGHPRHGEMHLMIPKDEAAGMRDWLIRVTALVQGGGDDQTRQ